MHHEKDALTTGHLHWWHSRELRAAAEALRTATSRRTDAERALAGGNINWRQRRQWRAELQVRQKHENETATEYQRLIQPERARLEAEIAEAESEASSLRGDVADSDRWHFEHPEVARRLHHIDYQLDRLLVREPRHEHLAKSLERAIEPPTATVEPPAPQIEQGIDLGMDLGL